MRQRSHTAQVQTGPTDAELTARASAGEIPAFEELYRRHSEAAWRVAQAVTGNTHDAADAVSDAFTRVFQALPTRLRDGDHFRPYLLAATRNAAIDGLRRNGRLSPTDYDQVEVAAVGNEPAELVMGDVDSSLVTRAFRSLPERWRSVLWLTEVEGIPPRDAAAMLGLSANGVAQLAVRARAGLRERFLQAHLGDVEVQQDCRYSVEHLGAYVVGGLAPRDIAKVDQHLAGCTACTARLAELEEIGPSLLRRAVLPIPVTLVALTVGKWKAAGAAAWAANATVAPGLVTGSGVVASSGAATGGTGVLGASSLVAAGATPFVASAASLALFVAGIVGVGVVDPRANRRSAPPPAISAPAFDVDFVPASAAEARAAADDPLAGLVPDAARTPAGMPDLAAMAPDAGLVPGPGDLALPTDPAVLAPLQLALDLGLLDVVLGVGGECAGLQVAGLTIGCQPSATAGAAPTLTLSIGILPDIEIKVPQGLLDALPLSQLPVVDQLLAGAAGKDTTVAPTPEVAPAPKSRNLIGRLLRSRAG